MGRNKTILSPFSFITYSLGCRTNQAEMETISLELADHGLQQVEDELPTADHSLLQPDLVLLNTCVVTQKAEKETRQKIKELRKKYPKTFLVVIGCAVTTKEKMGISLPKANLLINNKNKTRVIDLLEQKLGPFSKTGKISVIDNAYIRSGRKFIKIQDGCDLFCFFCLTAHLRGQLKSVSSDKVVEEINFWVSRGVKEIILTGINIALYGKDQKKKVTIVNLLKQILKETRAERITLSSIYPEMLSQEFLDLVINESRITRCFHLSLQSGSPAVLQRMNRIIDLDEVQKKLSYLKKKIPDFTFRVDLIAGFPGETKEEFQKTLKFIKETKISFAHVFPFSARKGTKAYEMIKEKKWQDLPVSVKQERVKKVVATVEKVRLEEAEKMVNKTFKTLIVKQLKNHSFLGITDNGWQITVESKQLTTKNKGRIIPVKISKIKNDQLLGEILSLPI